MAYGESNGHDVSWPWKVKLITPIRLERNISKTAGDAIVRQYGQLFQQQLGFLYLNGQSIVVGFLNHREFSKSCAEFV